MFAFQTVDHIIRENKNRREKKENSHNSSYEDDFQEGESRDIKLKKYILLKNDTITVSGVRLYRIKALISFGNVKKGELGGYIQSEKNLNSIYNSDKDDSWVYDNAKVYGNAEVFTGAKIYGNAEVFGNAEIYNEAEVFGNAKVYGNARICAEAKVYGNAQVYGNVEVYNSAKVYGNAEIYENAIVCGNAEVFGNAKIHGRAEVVGEVETKVKVCGELENKTE